MCLLLCVIVELGDISGVGHRTRGGHQLFDGQRLKRKYYVFRWMRDWTDRQLDSESNVCIGFFVANTPR